jgi:YVTN family beta-propeller protein
VQDDSISLINTKTLTQQQIKVGFHPYCAAITQDEKRIIVTNTQDDTVSIIDIDSKKTIKEIEVGMTPEGISIDHQHNRAYIANWGSNDVSVIDLNKLRLLTTIKTGDKSRAFGEFILQ